MSDLDFVFDMFNGQMLHDSVKVLKNGGSIVSLPTPEFAEETLQLAKERNVSIAFHMVQSNGKDMNRLSELLANGDIKPHISKTFAFQEMADAHLHLESGRTIGKVIITL